jgi:hypothetical protein
MGQHYNLARMTTATTGTGTITLGAAVAGFLTFAQAGVLDGYSVSYGIVDGVNSEVGEGIYTTSGTTLTRVVTKSTNSDTAINLSGTAQVYITHRAEDGFTTGDAKITLKTTADVGWVLMNDGTIGSATSGATRANADTKALFTLLYNNLIDANAPIQTSAGGATTRAAQTSAATAWTNNCRMSLTKNLGRALAIGGAGSGLTARTLGQTLGEENHTQSQAELAVHSHTLTDPTHGHPISDPGHFHADPISGTAGFNNVAMSASAPASTSQNTSQVTTGISITAASTGITGTNSQGAAIAFNVMQPTTFWNVMIKL